MTHAALTIIRDEHAALAAMLRSILLLLAQHQRQQTLPDFGALRAMLFYVDEFPERLHHRKESGLLFPLLRKRCPELASVLDRLDHDHEQGGRAIRELEHALLAFEVMGEPRRVAFEQAVAHYVHFYLEHMALEERELLPAARRAFSPADWVALDEAFAANQDPMTGHAPPADYAPLFQKILMSAPAPIGLGAAA